MTNYPVVSREPFYCLLSCLPANLRIGIMLINALLGFREEYHAKKALDEISNSIDSEIAVRRNGETKSISVKELVPGDVVLLVGGTIVPADTKWISGRFGFSLSFESAFTYMI